MRNILKKFAALPIRFYGMAISPLLPASCRFQPTCSAYMIIAIEKHGVLKGFVLGLSRLAKCHPWHKHCGPDPVPETFDWAALIGYKRG